MHIPRWVAGMVAVVTAAAALTAPVAASAAESPSAPKAAAIFPTQDPFYKYNGPTPLADIAPGTVLKTRSGSYTFPDVPLPISWTQLLYRTRTQLGAPDVTVTTVLHPTTPIPGRVVSYQSFYDSLTTRCQPSYLVNGGPSNGLWASETKFYEVLLTQGYTVVTSDFEGQDPSFATGPVYGYQTLDGIRAAFNDGLAPSSQVALVGYSGGAIATEWASELAPTYAPEINAKLIGAAYGGVFVHPMHNLHYVDGSQEWSGVMPLALIGIAKAFKLDLTKYLSPKGQQIINTIKDDCIGEHDYPGLTFAQLVKPQYAAPESIPEFVATANQLIMGVTGKPTIPMFIREGTDGTDEGTQPSPVYGTGDGVMLVNDVRTFARKYCDAGIPIDYMEKPLGHGNQGADFLVEMVPWLQTRFLGTPPTNTCATIAAGNDLSPTKVQSPGAVPAECGARVKGTVRFRTRGLMPRGHVNRRYRAGIRTGGTVQTAMYVCGGALPAGLTFVHKAGTRRATIVGRPEQAGRGWFWVVAVDKAGHHWMKGFRLRVVKH